MAPYLLPRFIFLSGPPGGGKTLLTNMLFKEVDGLISSSFLAPVRAALLGAFFDGDPQKNLLDPTTLLQTLPGTNLSVEEGLAHFEAFFNRLDTFLLGKLALEFVNNNADFYEFFVFDDLSSLNQIAPIRQAFGSQACVIVHLDRGPTDCGIPVHDPVLLSTTTDHIHLANDSTPAALFENAIRLLGTTITK